MPIHIMILYVLAMAFVTYLIRMIPFAFFSKKIKSQYVCSLLYYIPYAVLSAMTFPFILYSTGNVYTALVGTIIAIIASLSKQSLIVVAVLASLAVFGAQFLF